MRKKNSRRGSLLVEALVSMAIFLVASIAFYGLMANARRAETKARQTLVATALARELMEGCRIKGYTNLAVGTTTGTKAFVTSRDGVKGSSNMTYTVQVYDGPGTTARSIVVNVTWKVGKVMMESYVTN